MDKVMSGMSAYNKDLFDWLIEPIKWGFRPLREEVKGKGKGFPILDTERLARSWSRCTGGQPAGDRKSSTRR